MALTIGANTPSLTVQGALSLNSVALTKSLAKLSTGLRIVKAGDDASGLIISERLRTQVNALETAKLNAQEGISMLSTAEGALNQVHALFQRMSTLAVRAANDATIGPNELAALDAEYMALREEVSRIFGYATFNGVTLFDGSSNGHLQLGPGEGGANQIMINIPSLANTTPASLLPAPGPVITSLNAHIEVLSSIRGDLGVTQNRLENTIANLDVMIENSVASESRIRDVDMSVEISRFTRLQILQQAGVSVLAQANSQPQAVLSLLN